MFNNYTPDFNVFFLGFDERQQQQLECIVQQNAALLESVQVVENEPGEVIDVYFINYCEDAVYEQPAGKNSRIVCAGKFSNFEFILGLVHAGHYGCIACSAIDAEIIPALVSALQKKIYISPAFSSMIHGYFQNTMQEEAHRQNLFTEQEHILVQHLTTGALYKEIAWKLQISENTVRSHVRNIYSKLKVHSKTELAQKILKGNLITTLACFLPDFIACLCY